MELAIKKVILWPSINSLPIREIEFQLDSINVITGESGKGKSAIISIIDYCLASSSCLIPTGLIRESVSWFGIILKLGERQLLLARKSPGKGPISNDMFRLIEASDIIIPDKLVSNCNYRDVINLLNELGEISNLSLREDGDTENDPSKERVSIRDLISFNFQPQHIIANSHALFYKADSFKNREKLKNVFAYALGIIDNDILEKKDELIQVRREIQKLEKIIENSRLAADMWVSEVRTYYYLAREFGLIQNAIENLDDVDVSFIINALRKVREYLNPEHTPFLEEGVTSKIANRINNLRTREIISASKIDELKQSLIAVENINKSKLDYTQEVTNQKRRLDAKNWFKNNINRATNCPFCNSKFSNTNDIDNLIIVSEELSQISSKVSDSYKIFSREISKIKTQLSNEEFDLNNIRKEQSRLVQEDQDYQKHRQTLNKVYEFIGRLDESLKIYDNALQGGEISDRLKKLHDQESELDAVVNSLAIKRKFKDTIEDVGKFIKYYSAGYFKAERSNADIVLDIENLTLQFSSISSKNYLWEIGSGHNFMAYHISTVLAIHQFLHPNTFNKIPKFIIFDQPTQVYFPELKDDKALNDNDIERVTQIFKAMSDFFLKVNKGVQIIVLEHVGENAWKNLSNVKQLKRWREGEEDSALIPSDWIKDDFNS